MLIKIIIKTLIIFVLLNFIHPLQTFALEQLLIIRDEETASVLKDIIQPIFKAAGLSSASINIHIINHDDPNAFVMSGQSIFISTGLIKFSSDPNVIAGVIAHEVGHILGGHLTLQNQAIRNLPSKILIGLLASVAVGAVSQSPDALVATALGAYSHIAAELMSFTRAQECAADNTGVRIMKKLSIDPTGLLNFLRSLNTIERNFYNDISIYHQTHPLSKDRIEFIKANLILGSNNSYINDSLKERFKMVFAKIISFTSSPHNVFKQFANSSTNSAKYAIAIAHFLSQRKDKSLYELDQLIKIYPKSPYLLELKGQILFELGNAAQSIEFYDKAHRLKPRSDLISMEYANVLISENKDLPYAVNILNQILSKNRDESYAWNLLGKAYRKLDKDDEMHVAFAYEAYTAQDNLLAVKHLNAIETKNLSAKSLIKYNDLIALINESK